MDKKKKKSGNVRMWAGIAGIILALLVGFAAGKFFPGKDEGKKDKDGKKTSVGEESQLSTEYVKLGEYKGVEVDLTVTDEDVNDAIEELLEEKATYEQLEGTAQEGDTVNVNIVGTVDGEKYELLSADGEDITIGDGDWNYEKELAGMNTGETKTITDLVPALEEGEKDMYSEEEAATLQELAGREAVYEITLNYIQGEQILPLLDEAFVAENTKTGSVTVEDFREEKRKDLYQENVDYIGESAWEVILTNSEVVSYPEDMLKEIEDDIIEGYQGLADIYGCTLEEAVQSMGYASMEEFREEDLVSMCNDTAADYLVAEAIAKVEDLELSDDEYQDALSKEYTYYTSDYASIEEFEQAKGKTVRWETLFTKVKEWVGDQAKIA